MAEPLQRREPAEGEVKSAFRFVHWRDLKDPRLAQDFISDRDAGFEPLTDREREIPELQDGMSTYRTLEEGRTVWLGIARGLRRRNPGAIPRIGEYIAEVHLTHGQGFLFEDLNEVDGHMTIWGYPSDLAAAVVEIVCIEEESP